MNCIKSKNSKGFSIIEMLVVVTVFSIVAIISTQILAISLGGVIKSENLMQVRENVDHSLSTMERLLRNAKAPLICSGPNTRLDYTDENGYAAHFACLNDATGGYIASGSTDWGFEVRLTNQDIDIKCADVSVFQCQPALPPDVSKYVIMTLKAEDVSHSAGQGAVYESGTRVFLRN